MPILTNCRGAVKTTELRVRSKSGLKLFVSPASYVEGSSVHSGDVDKDGDNLSMPEESATLVDVVEVEEYVDVAGSSTPIRDDTSAESEGFSFREAMRHASIKNSNGVIDSSGLLLYRLLSLFHSSLVFLH